MEYLPQLILKNERTKPVEQRHPWIFSGAVERVKGEPKDGEIVRVSASNGEPLALAYYNSRSQIIGRILTWQTDSVIDADFWMGKIAVAVERRKQMEIGRESDAYRLINAEADGLPGLVVDRYGDWLVMQCLTLGIDQRKQAIAEHLAQTLQPRGIVERSDADVRKKEGLRREVGVLWGEPPPETLLVQEHGLSFAVNLLKGHKTGLYLDQRENRQWVCDPRWVRGKRVLNLFSYTGGFGLFAAKNAAAEVIHVDSSADILTQAEQNAERNQITTPSEYISADVFELLRHYRDTNEQFDLIILDPPKLVHSQGELLRATRAYKDLNWLAFRLLRPGGALATFSCSGLVSADLFQKVIFGALLDSGRDAQIVHTMTQSADHPISLTFPESAYLKGLFCLVE